VTEGQSVHSIDHLSYDQLISLWWGLSNYNSKGYGSEIKLPGIVAYDPNSSVNIAARISGRIEKYVVNYKYQVNRGQRLFDLYSRNY
jgi:Cu(I)/Ag(I) efflux system membrane fusion protein